MVAGEEFEHPVKGFEDAHQKNGDNEVMRCSIPVMREPPAEEKDEEAREGEPLEELDLGCKGKEGKGDVRGLRFEVGGLRTSDCKLRVGVGGLRTGGFGFRDPRFVSRWRIKSR